MNPHKQHDWRNYGNTPSEASANYLEMVNNLEIERSYNQLTQAEKDRGVVAVFKPYKKKAPNESV